jgi:hypothetical protein
LTYERWDARLIVLSIKPWSVPTLRGGFEGNVKGITVCRCLKVDASDYFTFRTTHLILQKEVVLEKCEMGQNSEVNLTKMDKDSDLKD